MVISGFDWDDDNVSHIELHQFTPEEVEEVLPGTIKVRRTRQKLYLALGDTLDGRLAFVVFRRLSGGMLRVITARDMDDSCMKKKLTPAKAPLPRFRSDEETDNYFQTHSVTDVWNQLPEAEPVKVSRALEKSIRDRHAVAKSPISIRLDSEQIAAAKKIAAAKSVGYQTQLRMWIAEGIRREAKRV